MSVFEEIPALIDGGGALRDPFDPKDEYYVPKPDLQVDLVVDLRDKHSQSLPLVYIQGETQSCTANAAAMAFWYQEGEGHHSAD